MIIKNNLVFYGACDIACAAAIIMAAAALAGSELPMLQPARASVPSDDSIVEQERVAVGGGNMTAPINRFSPAVIEIREGQSVVFYAQQNSTELHNVIFDLSNGSVRSSLELPFLLPQGVDAEQQLALASPFNLGAPIIQKQPDGSEAIIALNKLAFFPSVSDLQNNTRYLLGEEELQQQMEQAKQQGFFMPSNLSANYTMNGTERVVSSGMVLDVSGFGSLEEEAVPSLDTTTEASPVTAETGEGNATEATTASAQEESPPLPYPFLNTFTVTFEVPGTYEYFCAFHPAMTGLVFVGDVGGEQVIVADGGEEGEEGEDQTTATLTVPSLQ